MKDDSDFRKTIEKYNKQLRDFSRQSKTLPTAANVETPRGTPPPRGEDNLEYVAPARQRPLPDITDDAAERQNEPVIEQTAENNQNTERREFPLPPADTLVEFDNSYIPPSIPQTLAIEGNSGGLNGEGGMKVQVYTAKGAIPVEAALVLIYESRAYGRRLLYSEITDINGTTRQFSLPTVSAAESLKPGMRNPYASYNIQVSKDGYFTVQNRNIPIYDGQDSVSPVELIPIPENYGGDRVAVIEGTGPISLQ